MIYPLSEFIGDVPYELRRISDTNSNSLEKKEPIPQTINVKEKIQNNNNQKSSGLKTDIYLALMPLYYVTKFCGLYPVELKARGGGIYSAKLYKPAVFYGICLAIAFISSQAWGLWRDLRNGWKNSTRLSSQTALTVTCTDVTAIVTVMITAISNAPFRWSYLQRAMKILSEIDEKIGNLEMKRLQRISIILISCPLCYLMVISVLDFKAWKLSDSRKPQLLPDKGQINYLPLYFMYIIITMFESQYALITFNVGERFSRLNRFSRKILKCNKILEVASEFKQHMIRIPTISSELSRSRKVKPHEGFTAGNQKLIDSISTLTTLHGNLCDTTSLINIAFGIPLLTCVLGCMLHLINTCYFLYTEIKEEDTSGYFLLTQPLWVIFHIIMLLILVQPCYMTIVKCRETTLLVSQLLTLKWDPDVQKQLEIFSLQLLHRPLNFSACGLFSIDRGLVTSIAGAVATYLVILVQFQNENDCSQGTKDLKNATDIIFKNLSLAKSPKA